MTIKKEIKKFLAKYNLKPKKYLGQNFLIEEGVLKHIIKAAELKKKDVVLEIGAGFGILTKELAKKSKKVIAVEKDKEIAQILKKELQNKNIKNVKIIEGDILKLSISGLRLTTDYKIVANLPYYITSPVIKKFLEIENPPAFAKATAGKPKLMVLMVQKEVAKRICQKPPKMTLLAVSVQFYAEPKIIKTIKKDCFWPRPKVDSAIIKLKTKYKKPKINEKYFFKVVKAGFSSPRKQLKNNLKKVFGKNLEEVFKKTKIDKNKRAEALLIDEWISLAKNCKRG